MEKEKLDEMLGELKGLSLKQGLMVASFGKILTDYVEEQDMEEDAKKDLMSHATHVFMDWVFFICDEQATTEFAKDNAKAIGATAMLMSFANIAYALKED